MNCFKINGRDFSLSFSSLSLLIIPMHFINLIFIVSALAAVGQLQAAPVGGTGEISRKNAITRRPISIETLSSEREDISHGNPAALLRINHAFNKETPSGTHSDSDDDSLILPPINPIHPGLIWTSIYI